MKRDKDDVEIERTELLAAYAGVRIMGCFEL